MKKELAPIVLNKEEQLALGQLTSKGRPAVRQVKRVQVLWALHQGEKAAPAAHLAGVSLATVYNIHHPYLTGGLKGARQEAVRSGQPRKVTDRVEAEVTKLACSPAPDGRSRWTVRLINQKLIELGYELDDASGRLVLKKASSNPGSKSSGVSAR